MLTVQAPDADSGSGDRKMSISFSDTPQWNEISELKTTPTSKDHRARGSVSNLSDETSRRDHHSLFADAESQLTKILSVESSDHGEDDGKKGPEEVFTDKGRAAMVVIGDTKDIKAALDRKKAVEIFRKTPEARNASIFFQQAKFLVHQSRYKEAIVLINKAVDVDPGRKEWLTERSYCYFKMLQPEAALKYIDDVIRKYPRYFHALLLKGEILYSMWDLERAMLCFVDGRRLRPDNVECIRGVHKVRMALEEISAYRDSISSPKKKTKFKRSKSAKERMFAASPHKSVASSHKSSANGSSRHHSSKFSHSTGLSDSSSSPLSSGDEAITRIRSAKPSTAPEQRRSRYGKLVLKRMPTSETKTSSETISRLTRRSSIRPKTAIGQRQRSPTLSPAKVEEDVEGRRGSQFLRTPSQSGSSLRLSGRSSESSVLVSDSLKKYLSSSGEDTSSLSEPKETRRKVAKKKQPSRKEPIKARPTSCIGPKVAASLEKDRSFLESILKNKGLKKANTAFTKKALRIARDLHQFVKEREEYWSNRECFIRFSKQEDIFIA